MAWIESHQGIERHPKTLKLASAMGWSIDQTIGKLHRLWWWCLDYAPDGNVSRQSTDITAQAIGLHAIEGEKLIKALYDAEFLDKTSKNQYLLHDWMEYAGTYLKNSKYRRNPEKIQEIIALYSTIVNRQSADSQPKKHRKSTVPTNLTNQPNQPTKGGAKTSAFVLPEWINQDAWTGYEEMRREKKKVPTDRARDLVVKELESLKAKGHDPTACLEQSTRNGWTDVYELKNGGTNAGLQTSSSGRPGRNFAAEREAERKLRLARVCGTGDRTPGGIHREAARGNGNEPLEGQAVEIPEVEVERTY